MIWAALDDAVALKQQRVHDCVLESVRDVVQVLSSLYVLLLLRNLRFELFFALGELLDSFRDLERLLVLQCFLVAVVVLFCYLVKLLFLLGKLVFVLLNNFAPLSSKLVLEDFLLVFDIFFQFCSVLLVLFLQLGELVGN